MSKKELIIKLFFGERFTNIHQKVSRNNLLVDSYIINTQSIISSNNFLVKSSIFSTTQKDTENELIEDTVTN